MGSSNGLNYTLALDVGSMSVGWAVIETGKDNNPKCLIDCGSRIFEAGVGGDLGSIETGKDESKSIKRREMRGIRRNLDRRARRLANVYSILSDAGLLPEIEVDHNNGDSTRLTSAGKRRSKRRKRAEARDKILAELDKEIVKELEKGTSRLPGLKTSAKKLNKKLPYILRTISLDNKLEKFELGRALYHLAQRRGFLSNRKKPDTKEEGQVKKAISELEGRIQEFGARTLGEYFSMLNPEVEKIRRIWTSRNMYIEEFDCIWEAQKGHHPEILTDELKGSLSKAMFYQRPLKSQKGKIGHCEHEPYKRRAPIAILNAQRFRYMQMVNNSRIQQMPAGYRDITESERKSLIDALEYTEKVTFTQAKKMLGLPRTSKFNLEEGGEKRFVGNKTSAALYEIFGQRWKEMSDADRNRIVEDILSIQKADTLVKRGMKVWGLEEESAKKLAEVNLEQGYSRLSRQAIRKLLPLLSKGLSYSEAVDEIYGFNRNYEVHNDLPPLSEMVPELTNPAVIRSLTEIRKVVNGVIKKYGKPGKVRIELARELKRSRKLRQEITKKNRANEKTREDAAERIISETGIKEPSRDDKLKVILADECNWECPYTGITISMGLLFDTPQFDIEHIIPFSRCFDNSYMNKTLCYHEENRNRKRNKTPYEAYHGTSDWDDIIERVSRFKGNAAQIKLGKFLLSKTDDLTDFTSRQLNDTRYASKLAAKYLACLYGDEYRKHIEVLTGQITAFVRGELELNDILGDGGRKERNDHRHHAVDAIAIGLIDRSLVKRMSDASKRAVPGKRKLFGSVEPPWEGFKEDAIKAVDSIIVSHRIDNQVNAALHEESFYAVNREGNSIRKRIDILRESDVGNIVDAGIRKVVENKIRELGGGEPAKLFSDPNNAPVIVDSEGEMRRVRSVAVKVRANPFKVGEGITARHVMTKSNHHVEIFEIKDKKGNPKWVGEMVSQFEAMERKRKKIPVINREHKEGGKFKFSLFSGSLIEIDEEDGKRGIYRVRTVSINASNYIGISYVKNNDARLKKDIISNKGWYPNRPPESLRKINCQKVIVTPTGEVRNAND